MLLITFHCARAWAYGRPLVRCGFVSFFVLLPVISCLHGSLRHCAVRLARRVHSFTPIGTYWLTAVCSALVIAFGVVISNDSDLTVAYADRFDIMGVLALFVILNAFVGYLLELSLRQTFLSEYLLYANERTLKTQQKVSNDLLQAMLPLTVIEQVRTNALDMCHTREWMQYYTVPVMLLVLCDTVETWPQNGGG